MTRIESTFARLRDKRRTGLVTYVTAGDPDLARSAAILVALDRAGADVLEVGVPFSDPLADGPEIQRASERALRAGATLDRVLDLVASLRADVAAPIVLFSYVNPIVRMGEGVFARRAAAAGVDGVLLLDLPIEEATGTRDILEANGLAMIFLLSPTTTQERMARAAALGRGFLYGISRLGVTGTRDRVASGARELAARVRAVTTLPLAVGFGISQPAHVREVGAFADAAVVGSALVRTIAEAGGAPDLTERVADFVRWLKGE
jgi:tryptophan synthase alpha chain